jgi:hypothetical protein
VKEGDEIGKLQFRVEDGFWNAYYTEENREPVFLGGVSDILTKDNKRRQDQFISLMQDLFTDMIQKKFGIAIGYEAPYIMPASAIGKDR